MTRCAPSCPPRRSFVASDARRRGQLCTVPTRPESTYRSGKTVQTTGTTSVDNLNTHFGKCFNDVLGKSAARRLLRRVVFHYTPTHASWLNMAEIEIGVLSRQCLDRRLPDSQTLQSEVAAWQRRRNSAHRTIEWTFTRQDADRKLGHHYVS